MTHGATSFTHGGYLMTIRFNRFEFDLGFSGLLVCVPLIGDAFIDFTGNGLSTCNSWG